jgi:hypothetical protein
MNILGRWRAMGAIVVLIVGIGLAASPFMGVPATAADPIKIGWVGPLSPPGGYAEGALMCSGSPPTKR